MGFSLYCDQCLLISDPVVVPADRIECLQSGQVIYSDGWCDGFVDCLADEDESDCSRKCKNAPNRRSQLSHTAHKCLHS